MDIDIDYFQILDVKITSTKEEIRKAYKNKAKKAHPDKGGSNEEFLKLREAYDCLIDKKKRKEYINKLMSLKKPTFSLKGGSFGRTVNYYIFDKEKVIVQNGSMNILPEAKTKTFKSRKYINIIIY